MKWMLTAMAAITMTLAACGSDDAGALKKTPSILTTQTDASEATQAAAGDVAPAATTSTSTTPQTTGATTGGDIKTYAEKPPLTIDIEKKYFATIKMDIGDIKMELFPKEAPETVNSFVFLARDGYYDGVTFHRVIPGFVAQGGDPTGTGRGGPGYTIPDEVNSHKFLDGTIGMAKTAAPNSGGSQFYICYAPQPNLDGGYTVFGQIVEGRDVLDKITPRDPARATTPGTAIITVVIEEE